MREGRFDDALGPCRHLASAGCADLVALGAMSRSALVAGVPREAVDDLGKADAGKLWSEVEKNERAGDAVRWIVRCAAAFDRDDLALKYLEPLRQSGFTKSSSDLLRTCVALFEKRGMREKAIAALRGCGRLLKLKPDCADALRDAGECFYELGRFEEALSRDPALEWTMFSLGKT